MTPEVRAEKWFRNIPEAKRLDLMTRMNICKKVSNILLVSFILILIAEIVIAFIITDGQIFNIMADKINLITSQRRRHRLRNLVVACLIVVSPFLIIPIIANQIMRRILINRAVKKY